jgi:glycosyltransferase involved in cell wall biosynthesis
MMPGAIIMVEHRRLSSPTIKMKNNPPVICLVTDTYWPAKGGVEAWVHAHSCHLGRKYTVSVIAHAKDESLGTMLSRTVTLKGFDRFSDDFGNPVSCLSPSFLGRMVMLPFILWNFPLVRRLWPRPVFDFLYVFYKAAFFARLSEALLNADLVHCFSTGHLAACVSDVCTKRGIGLIHSPPVHSGKWGDSPLLMSAYARADIVACLSESFKKDFENKARAAAPQLRISAVPALTIEYSGGRRPSRAPPQPFVLFLGRREKHKGLDLLLSAFERSPGKAALVIAGPGMRNPVSQSACFDMGEVDEAEKQWLLENCELFCMPSEDESFGIVYTEAMRCAKPVVALDIAPVNEIMVNGKTGILVPAGDRDALASALVRLLDNAGLRTALGQNGQKRYKEKYSPGVVVIQIFGEYERLV